MRKQIDLGPIIVTVKSRKSLAHKGKRSLFDRASRLEPSRTSPSTSAFRGEVDSVAGSVLLQTVAKQSELEATQLAHSQWKTLREMVVEPLKTQSVFLDHLAELVSELGAKSELHTLVGLDRLVDRTVEYLLTRACDYETDDLHRIASAVRDELVKLSDRDAICQFAELQLKRPEQLDYLSRIVCRRQERIFEGAQL